MQAFVKLFYKKVYTNYPNIDKNPLFTRLFTFVNGC